MLNRQTFVPVASALNIVRTVLGFGVDFKIKQVY